MSESPSAARTPASLLKCSDHMPMGPAGEQAAQAGLSQVALGLVGSEILKIAAAVRGLQAKGHKVCNLTVGDFLPSQFPIPQVLQEAIARAYDKRETNYPPSDGMPALREAVCDYYRQTLGLDYPIESVVICGGARPAIYGTYRAIIERGERVIFPTPSWNNNHYVQICEGVPVECPTRAEDGFMPTVETLLPLLPGARLLCLNSPLNPTGTVLGADQLGRICDAILDENRRRATTGERPLYLMYDQVYYTLTFGAVRHYTPPELRPAMAAYTIFVDAISKSLCATGLRVGWAMGPPYVIARMRDVLGHVGAWAPRAEQIAAAEVLRNTAAMADFHQGMKAAVKLRLDLLYEGFAKLQALGLPVRAVPPEGAIYLTVQCALHGGKLPSGETLTTNEQIRRYLLEAAGMAVVPFQAFGMKEESGWFRLSVGAVSPAEITELLPRLEHALTALTLPA